jgi:hypothetical protein
VIENDQLAQALRIQLNNCVGYAGDELDNSRVDAYNYYFQRARGDEIAGRSSIVTGDISAMVEGNLAQMVEPLINKRIAEFCSYNKDDEEQAQLESDCINELIFKRQNGFIELAAAIKDALLLRNGVVKIYIDKRTYKQTIRRSNVSPEVVTTVLDQIGETKVHSYDATTGKLSATVTKETQKFTVEALANENFLVPKGWHRQDLDNIPFCAERHVESRSTLVERGFKKSDVDGLPKYVAPSMTSANARLPRQTSVNQGLNTLDQSQELVEWFECYARMGTEDGTSELRTIALSGGQNAKILENEAADTICYATGTAIINPHSWVGISLYDKLKSTQDSTVALTRALMDNLNATSKNRTAHLDGVVEESDLTDGRVNGSIRVKPGVVGDVRAAVAAFSVPDTSANILQNLQQFRQVRSEMGGATLDMATGQMQMNDRLGSQGLDRAYSVMEQLAAFMTKMIANTLVRQMYLIAHEVLRTSWDGPISFKRGMDWLIQEPSKWPVRDAVHVNLGKPPNERAREAAAMDALITKIELLAQNGMEDILVNAESYYNAVIDWCRVQDIAIPERYILSPKTPQAAQAFKAKAAQRQKDKAVQDALTTQAISLEQLRVALDKYKADQDTQFKYYSVVLDAQVKEAQLTVPAVVDLLKVRNEAKQAAGESNDSDAGTEKDSGGKVEEEPAA